MRTTWLIAALALSFAAATGWAQSEGADDDAQDAEQQDDAFDEIVVTAGGRPDDAISVQSKYDELLRARLMKDIDMQRALDEEYDWRKTDTAKVDGPVRIRWGYDARDHLKLREEADLLKLDLDKTRPATLFSVEF